MSELPIDGDALPSRMDCAGCGDEVDAGYVPVVDGSAASDAAVCRTCGWTEVGMNGCAPTLSDFAVDAAALVRLAAGDDGPVPEAITDE